MKRRRATTRHSLGSGIPCVSHSCVQCCCETSMQLSSSDIARIVKLGYEVSDFVKTSAHGAKQLKNVAGRCIFLSEGGCTIYPDRPEGCQLYPLIWDEDRGQAIRDYFCPHAGEFDVKKPDTTNLKKLIGRLKT